MDDNTMSGAQIVFFVAVFSAVSLIVYLLGRYISALRVSRRLPEAPKREGAPLAPWAGRVAGFSHKLAKFSAPGETQTHSSLRQRFLMAGLRDPSLPMLFFAAKTLLAMLLPTLVFVYVAAAVKLGATTQLLALLAAAALGYYLPNLLLANRIARRRRDLFESFPDVLDLLTVCVEAGLAIDSGLARVVEEIRLSRPVLADELRLVILELRAGSTRNQALHNLSLRTGVEDIHSLVATLTQADRLGTGIAGALRTHSDNLRTKRRLRAEEAAAKISLKLLFPLIFCIFPSLFVVLMGPAFIQIFKVLTPVVSH
jgi:tight adherence protein C